MEFFKLYEMVKGNILYWSTSIQINTNFGVDRDDAYQELLIAVFNWWSTKKNLTKYYVQKRLYYTNIKMLKKYYVSNYARLNPIYIEVMREDKSNDRYDLFDETHSDVAVLNKIEMNDILEKLVYKLGGEGKRASIILKMIMQGMSIRDIAEELKMTKSNVNRIKQEKIKVTLQKIINNK